MKHITLNIMLAIAILCIGGVSTPFIWERISTNSYNNEYKSLDKKIYTVELSEPGIRDNIYVKEFELLPDGWVHFTCVDGTEEILNVTNVSIKFRHDPVEAEKIRILDSQTTYWERNLMDRNGKGRAPLLGQTNGIGRDHHGNQQVK